MPLSQKQMEYLALAWQCFETEPKIDYEKFKTIANLASAASARELMRVTKNKLKAEYGALGGGDAQKKSATPVTPGGKGKAKSKTPTPSAKKRDRADGAEDDNDGEGEGDEVEVASPLAKKARAVKSVKEKGDKKKGGVAVKMEEQAGEEEETDYLDLV